MGLEQQVASDFMPIYLVCLIIGGGYLVVTFLFGLDHEHLAHDIGGHHLVDSTGADSFDTPEGGHHSHSDHDGPRVISLQSILTFMAGFGAIGVITGLSAVTLLLSLIYSVLAGLATATLAFWFLSFAIRQQSSEHATSKDFQDVNAEVITRIPPDGDVGEVSAIIKGQYVKFLARAEKLGETFPEGAKVTTISYEGGIATVVADSQLS